MNAYVLVCELTRKSVLIDPGDDLERLSTLLKDTTPVAIMLTHTHPDHVGALEAMRARLRVPVWAHGGPHFGGFDPRADRVIAHGDALRIGASAVSCFYTPGHCDDQLCFAVMGGTNIVVGDTVFDGGPGRTASTAAFARTLQTLREVVLNWPDEARCHPGHGPSFRLGDRRAAIAAFVARDHAGFFGDASWG